MDFMKNLPNLDNFLVPPGSESIKQQPPKNESNGGRPQLQLRSYFYYLSNPDERPSLDLWRLYSALAEDLPVLNRELVRTVDRLDSGLAGHADEECRLPDSFIGEIRFLLQQYKAAVAALPAVVDDMLDSRRETGQKTVDLARLRQDWDALRAEMTLKDDEIVRLRIEVFKKHQQVNEIVQQHNTLQVPLQTL